MKMETLVKRIAKLEKERSELFELRRPIDQRIQENSTALERLREQRGKMIVAEMPKGTIDIELILTAEHRSQTLHREADRQAAELGLYRSGIWPAINQASIKLMLYKNDPDNLKKTYEGIMLLLPHIIPRPAIDVDGKPMKEVYIGKKVFSIFEHTLSINGSYYFLVCDDETVEVVQTRYSSTTVIHKAPTIMDGLKYVQKYLYYSDKDDD